MVDFKEKFVCPGAGSAASPRRVIYGGPTSATARGCQAEGNCPEGCPCCRVPPAGTEPVAASSESHQSKEPASAVPQAEGFESFLQSRALGPTSLTPSRGDGVRRMRPARAKQSHTRGQALLREMFGVSLPYGISTAFSWETLCRSAGLVIRTGRSLPLMVDPIQVELGLGRMSSVGARPTRAGRQPALLHPSLLLHEPMSWASSCLSSAGGWDSGGHLGSGKWSGLVRERFLSCSGTGGRANTLKRLVGFGWQGFTTSYACVYEANVSARRH